MKSDGYIVKFVNYATHPEGTGKLHYDVLKQHGKCIWGQWSPKGGLMYETTYKRMNTEVPFSLYAVDKQFAILKMTVERVLRKEEVIAEGLEYLIPSYYSVETSCASFYLISSIESFPIDEIYKLIISSSGNCADRLNQVNSCGPVRVYWDNNASQHTIASTRSFLPPISKDEPEDNDVTNSERCHTIYRYRFKDKPDRCYIGRTSNLKRRIAHHSNQKNWLATKEQWKVLYVMFQSCGYDSFEFDILHENLTLEEAKYLEAWEIENHQSYYRHQHGFNVKDESENLKHKPATLTGFDLTDLSSV